MSLFNISGLSSFHGSLVVMCFKVVFVVIVFFFQNSQQGVVGRQGSQVFWSLLLTKSHIPRDLVNEKSSMHYHSTEFFKPRIDTRLLKEVLRLIVTAVEFLAKQGLPFRGNKDDNIDFSDETVNRGNFVATLQLPAKGSTILQNHLLYAKRNALYTSKTIQNEIINNFMHAKSGNA